MIKEDLNFLKDEIGTVNQMQKTVDKFFTNTVTVSIGEVTDLLAVYLRENNYKKIIITMENIAKFDDPIDLVETLVFKKNR